MVNLSAAVTLVAPGSGANGPQTAQVGVNAKCSKSNYLAASTVGEVDCIYAMLRQDGPNSDGSGLLVDALFGAGLSRPIEGPARTMLQAVKARKIPTCAVDVPSGVIATFPSLSDLQTDFFTTVFHADGASDAWTTNGIMCLEPTNLLLECLVAARAKDWPRFIVLIHDATSDQCRLSSNVCDA